MPAQFRNIVGRAREDLVITTRFYVNGVLFNPFNISSVEIYDAETGGTLQASLTPVNVSIGEYTATWSIPAGQAAGTYYDRWTWQAQSDMSSQIRVYSFRVDSPVASADSTRTSGKGPLFVTSKEICFFNHIGKELIQRIVGQQVIYYSVSEEHTKSHRLYDEAIRKTTFRPVEMNALILYNEPQQTVGKFSIDTTYTTEMYFHIHELEERNVIPREGDFIKWGTVVYEIEQLTKPQIVYGQINNRVMVKAKCRVARKSQFEVLDSLPTQ